MLKRMMGKSRVRRGERKKRQKRRVPQQYGLAVYGLLHQCPLKHPNRHPNRLFGCFFIQISRPLIQIAIQKVEGWDLDDWKN
jgi:hypothetical protein